MTIEEVASIYSTTPENVEEAVREYQERNNPFREFDDQIKIGIIEIAISIISAVLILFTLFEMQAERNAAYMPSISINCENMKFSWDENSSLCDYSSNFKGLNGYTTEALDAYEDSYKSGFPINMSVQNTGVGVAREVYVDWLYEDNIPAFQKLFSDVNDISVLMENYQINIVLNKSDVIGMPYQNSESYQYGFLSPDLDKTESMNVPLVYMLLYQIAVAHGFQHDLPEIRFSVKYKDVQGEVYLHDFTIEPEVHFAFINTDNAGTCLLDLYVNEKKKEHLSIKSKSGYFVLGGCLVVLIEGLAFIIFGRLQKNYKRSLNSIKDKQEDDKKPETKCAYESSNQTEKINNINSREGER